MMLSSNMTASNSERINLGNNFLILLIFCEGLLLIPVFLEEYLIAFVCFIGVFALLFVFGNPVNGLILLPLFIFLPFEIPGMGGIQFSELGTFMVLLSFVFAILVSRGKLEFETPAILPIMLILVASIFSMINAPYFGASVKNVLKYIEAFVLIFVLTVNYANNKEIIQKILFSIMVAAVLASIVGFVMFLGGTGTRVFGLSGGGFGAYIGVGGIIALNIMVFSKSTVHKVFAALILLLLVAALILSQTRAWLLGTIVACIFVFYNLGNKKRTLLFSLILISLVAAVFLFLSQDAPILRQSNITVSTATEQAFQTGLGEGDNKMRFISLLMRIFMWIRGFEIYLQHPILGFGIGNLRFKSAFTAELGNPSNPDVGYIDNHWLNILYETGILGIIGWIWLAVVIFRTCKRLVQRSDSPDFKLISLSLSGSMIIFLFGSMFWALTVVHEMTVFLPFLMGLSFAAGKVLPNEQLQESK